MPSGLKPDDRGFCRIRRLLGSCLDEPGRFSDPDWKAGSAWEKGQLEKSSAGLHLSSSSCLMQYRKTNFTCNKLLKCLARKWGDPRCRLPTHFITERNPHKRITLPRETCTHTETHLNGDVQKELERVTWLKASDSFPLKSSYKCYLWGPGCVFFSPHPLAPQCLLVMKFSEQRDRPSTGECRDKEPLGRRVLEKAPDCAGAAALTRIQNAPVVLPRKLSIQMWARAGCADLTGGKGNSHPQWQPSVQDFCTAGSPAGSAPVPVRLLSGVSGDPDTFLFLLWQHPHQKRKNPDQQRCQMYDHVLCWQPATAAPLESCRLNALLMGQTHARAQWERSSPHIALYLEPAKPLEWKEALDNALS